jgi:hypothetical protein
MKPIGPPNRIICDACGELKEGKHTNWICMFFKWLDKKVT